MLRSFFGCLAVLVGLWATSAHAQTTPQLREQSIQVGDLQRSYYFYKPTPSRTRQPLVIVLHGGGGHGSQVSSLGFQPLAMQGNFVLAYPNGLRGWNDGRASDLVVNRTGNADDIGFLRAMIAQLSAQGDVDPQRVYVVGISNGGMMAMRMGCEMANEIKGIAAVIANLPEALVSTCRPARPVPVLIMNGTEDPLMPYLGGSVGFAGQDRGRVISTDRTVDFWRNVNGCRANTQQSMRPNRDPRDGTRVLMSTSVRCRANAEVRLYSIQGGGHGFPDLREGRRRFNRDAITGKTSRDIDGAQEIISFFRGHGL
jgi:polyhydroxybutyrate depolymerase